MSKSKPYIGILMKELLSMNIIEITSCNVKGPFTHTLSESISVTVTVNVSLCHWATDCLTGRFGSEPILVHQSKGSFAPRNSVTVTNVTLTGK